MKRALLILATIAFLTPTAAWAKKSGKGKGGGEGRELTFKKGTMELGGAATFDLYSYDGNSSWNLDLSPTGGYFLKRRLELVGMVNLSMAKGQDALGWGLDGGLRYFFDMKPNWAYVGALAGYASTKTLEGYGMGGFLIPLSQNVGLDLGGRIGVQKTDGADGAAVAISAGYLGVHGFFR